jgi:hypothetical protein
MNYHLVHRHVNRHQIQIQILLNDIWATLPVDANSKEPQTIYGPHSHSNHKHIGGFVQFCWAIILQYKTTSSQHLDISDAKQIHNLISHCWDTEDNPSLIHQHADSLRLSPHRLPAFAAECR